MGVVVSNITLINSYGNKSAPGPPAHPYDHPLPGYNPLPAAQSLAEKLITTSESPCETGKPEGIGREEIP